VKSLRLWRGVCSLIAGSLLALGSSASAQTKSIRLRNEIIVTSAPTNGAHFASGLKSNESATGLFLVQFMGPLEPAHRNELRSAGVDLLKYVPEDAFITKFNGVTPAKVGSLGFVRWVGPYRPEHKIHPRLSLAAREAAQSNRTVSVSIMISPQATPPEIAGVRSLLSSIQHESHLRQGTFVRGELPPGRLDALAQSAAVLWLEPAPRRHLVDEMSSKLIGGADGRNGTPTVTERLGFGGSAVTVCVADTGLDSGDTNTMHPDLRGRVTGFQFYGLPDGSDGYGHGTHCAGIVAGNAATGEKDPDSGAFYGLGVASQANLFIERIFDDSANEVSPAPSDEQLTHDAVRGGAKIGSNSWGNDVQGEYDTDAAQFDELVRDADASTPGDQPYILEFSAGNAGSGSQTLDSPASGKNVIATGASENDPNTLAVTYGLYADGSDTMADFSSRGPCEDGRIKPDLVAPGTWIASAASSAAADEASIAWSTIDNYYVYMGGTSMSGPHAAGAAAVFVQYYQSLHTNATPSPALVKAALINSANELDELNGGPGPIPNFDEGWGRITLTNIIVTNFSSAPRFYQYLDQSVLLTNGQVYVQHAFVRSSGQPLKITLTYTDVPGFPGASPALVNDLDLEVVAPDGTLYRGNQFGGEESAPNPPVPDNLNNVEAVHLLQPIPGDYLVRVRARSVVEDARQDTPAIDQDFALVVSGDLTRPGQGLVLLDRAAYTAPSFINVSVLDLARAASNTASVVVKSTTETVGETYTLNSAGSYGAFTGAVATVVGAAAVDGKLEIHNGDAIEADYVDGTGTKRTATALANLIPPVLSAVTSSLDLAVITITWQTSEPASSIVRYGTNQSNLNLAVTNSALTTSHLIRLTGLIPGKIYYFLVSSTDGAGNTATNNNSGSFFDFIGVAAPTVLLVDAYESDSGSPVIPDGTYTNAVAAAGYSYGFWKVTQRGAPELADLQPFPVVIWRTTDDIVNYTGTNNTLTPDQQFMIQTYLDEGGSFFMASMGILTQLGDVPFRRNVLQVAGFVQNLNPPAPCSDCDEDFGVPAMVGAAGSPLTGGMSITLNYGNYPTFDDGAGDVFGPDFSDTFTPATNASSIVFESVSGKPCGMSYPPVGVDSPGRVVFLSFPLDAVPFGGTPPDNEVALLRNILNFLAPGANGVGTVFLDRTLYTTNSTVLIEVGDSDLAGTGQAQATISASSKTNLVSLLLRETSHPGLFSGSITLVAANAATNQLAVRNGDTIKAVYFEASNNSNVVAVATVDTVPPVISNVGATTSYGDAQVTWTTSKPSDSLVQYGPSSVLGLGAYASALVTNHSVSISGLSANQTYFYEVASRDAAGNTAVNNNQGAFFMFQTLQAPRPPWFDNLESGAGNWKVVPDPVNGSDINWTLGTPNNGLQTSAHSGTNAWCSDIDGSQNFFLASSYLYGPVIDLSGLTQATLTFWDSFDFSQIYEDGVVMISTNSSTPPGSLATLADFTGQTSDAWEQETVDLSAYVGQTVQVVWYYQGVAGASTIYGWLVDDIGITGVAAGGTIVIAKNLGQGIFTLTTPIPASPIVTGSALLTTITNAPAGQYTAQFSDVPFYLTPDTQTNTLAAGGTLNFSGNYTFLDANHNGISDDWERYYFGVVSTNRTQFTDTDGDGMSDYAEFIAGTNPTNAASKFYFVGTTIRSNRLVQLQWTVATNRLYQIQSTTNASIWTPATGWVQASNNPVMSYTTTNSATGAHLYRVQVRP